MTSHANLTHNMMIDDVIDTEKLLLLNVAAGCQWSAAQLFLAHCRSLQYQLVLLDVDDENDNDHI